MCGSQAGVYAIYTIYDLNGENCTDAHQCVEWYLEPFYNRTV